MKLKVFKETIREEEGRGYKVFINSNILGKENVSYDTITKEALEYLATFEVVNIDSLTVKGYITLYLEKAPEFLVNAMRLAVEKENALFIVKGGK